MRRLSTRRLTPSIIRTAPIGDHPDAEVRGLTLHVTATSRRFFLRSVARGAALDRSRAAPHNYGAKFKDGHGFPEEREGLPLENAGLQRIPRGLRDVLAAVVRWFAVQAADRGDKGLGPLRPVDRVIEEGECLVVCVAHLDIIDALAGRAILRVNELKLFMKDRAAGAWTIA